MMERVTSVVVSLIMAGLLLEGLGARPPKAAAFGPPSDQPLAIVVNRSNPVDNLSFAELRRIFMGERSHWANGRRITLVMIENGQPERKAMLREVYQMNENDFNTHFLHGTFTGEVFVAPKTLATSVGVRKFVFNVPGAIGYMRAADVDSSVKVLRIDGHLPDDKEYKFRMEDLPGSKP